MPEVFMPRLSDTMEEGAVSRWLISVGDRVEKGDAIAEIDTDKATMELEAYDAGVLTQVLVEEGVSVVIGAPIAVIGEAGEVPAASSAPVSPTPSATPAAPPAAAAAVGPGGQPAQVAPAGGLLSSPIARGIARDHGIELSAVTGTGPGGRIVRADVEAAVAAKGGAAPAGSVLPPPPPATSPTTPAAPAAPASVAAAPPAQTPVARVETTAEDEVISLSKIRRITARRLVESMQNAPHFYLTTVVDADALMAFRAEVNARLAPAGVKISVNDLIVKAAAVSLRKHPAANASWGGDTLVRHARIHVGVAVALPEGLIVPVVRDADRKPVGEIAQESRALAAKARAGKLTPDEFTGGTFTVSNLGMFGVDHFTAVINPPEAAILAVGAAKSEPVARDGVVVVGTTIKMTLSIDHRVLDGATAAAFLATLTQTLEEPLSIVV